MKSVQIPYDLFVDLVLYMKQLYRIGKNDRLFEVTKSYLHHEMDRGAKAAGVKRIRIHDLRHSHISLLIEMGYSAVAIADRVGHESIVTTVTVCHALKFRQAVRLPFSKGIEHWGAARRLPGQSPGAEAVFDIPPLCKPPRRAQ